MKKIILITLLFVVCVKHTVAGPVRPRDSYSNFKEFVQDVKKAIITDPQNIGRALRGETGTLIVP